MSTMAVFRLLWFSNFIRDHKNWCRTCTSFEKELRRYFHWEESEKVSTDVEHILHLRRSWEGISIWEGWIFSNILIWEGIEKVFLLRRTWEAWNYYRVVEMDLRRWDGSEKEMYPPSMVCLPLYSIHSELIWQIWFGNGIIRCFFNRSNKFFHLSDQVVSKPGRKT